jgi:hypothetical protein
MKIFSPVKAVASAANLRGGSSAPPDDAKQMRLRRQIIIERRSARSTLPAIAAVLWPSPRSKLGPRIRPNPLRYAKRCQREYDQTSFPLSRRSAVHRDRTCAVHQSGSQRRSRNDRNDQGVHPWHRRQRCRQSHPDRQLAFPKTLKS